MALLAGSSETVELDPRTPGPIRRLDLYVAVGTSAFACVAYVAALFTTQLPPTGFAVVLFAAVPLCALLALVVLQSRARAEPDAALAWVSAGLGVGVVVGLQLLAFPEVGSGGGVLGTGGQSRSALFLLFHLTLAAGAVAGAVGASLRWWLPSTAAGVVLVGLLAADAVPLPHLLRADGSYTPALEVALWALTALTVIAVVVWVLRVGRAPSALRGWVGVACRSAYDLALNAIGGARFQPVWWSSLSVRVATYGVLAMGCTWSVLGQLRDVESYSDTELLRREAQLRNSLGLTRRLLRCAEDLARAVTPDEVATVLCTDAVALSGVPRAALLVTHGTASLRLLGTAGSSPSMRARIEHLGWDAPLPGPRAILTRRASFLGTREMRDRFPTLAGLPMGDAAAAATLPITVRGETIGAMVVWDTQPRHWTQGQQDLLVGLAAQGGQAVARATAYEAQATAASTLQESLLPSRLPRRRGRRAGGEVRRR